MSKPPRSLGRTHADEPHEQSVASRLNWLRAGVLGANDGIVSTAGLVVGVAGATETQSAVLVAGVAGLVAGAISMAAGEYVSVSTQRDSELALLDKERAELRDAPEAELEELAGLYVSRGVSERVALEVAKELTAHDALAAHAEVELGIDSEEQTNPWHAAWASMLAFTLGALLPLLVIVFTPIDLRVYITAVAVALALAVTGYVSARLGGSPPGRAVIRNVCGGVFAMVATHVVGLLIGGQV
ncbi:VIT1/CCC1 transporter family protein [Nocardioides campestrisoli]|uniref:VIT1/CCC1 transporter family protein n=1 Tax=Nocardioides campestrisoli TaxID=2736757 RepID=UPI00163D52CA|nr:VIT family protein [Nocardioides campestrisoli]